MKEEEMKGDGHMILEKGDKVHIIVRRAFETDIRRHFVGTVVSDVENNLVQLQGYAFVLDTGTNQWEKRPEKRNRIFSLVDGRHIINVISRSVDVDKVHYAKSKEGHIVVTDGGNFTLDINEFGVRS